MKDIDVDRLLAGVDIVRVIQDAGLVLKKQGAEYVACCPFHAEASPSFSVSPSKQFYHCFGCGAHGNAIDFLMQYQNIGFREACSALGATTPAAPPPPPPPPTKAPIKTFWKAVLPAPSDAPPRPRAHVKRGIPEAEWTYKNTLGHTLGYVYRFKRSDGGKEVLPLVWARHNKTGAQEWRWLAFPEPRPLYGLDILAEYPNAIVLIVEGEKCAEAAQITLHGHGFVVITWPGGSKAVGKIDLSPLYGRMVILWADCDAKRELLTRAEKLAIGNDPAALLAAQAAKPLLPEADQPGTQAMAAIAATLLENGCKVWRVAIPAPGEKPDGWDIADAIAEGLTGAELKNWIKARSMPLAAANSAEKAPNDNAGAGEKTHPPSTQAGAGRRDYPPEDAWRADLLYRSDRLIDCRENVYTFLKNHPVWCGVLWFDDFARRIVCRRQRPWDGAEFKPGAEWKEDDDFRLGKWLADTEGLIVRAPEVLANAIGWCARDNPFHPVRDYLDAQHWDEIPRVDHWLIDFLGIEDTPYSRLSGRMFLIAMVARIYLPGCQMRAMPILEGGQFKGKSTAMRILGGEWFSDTPLDMNNKDSYQLIQGRWLYEIAELDAFNRAETTRIKAFISSREDRFRAPYGHFPQDFPRHTVFVGTTNQDEYFKDPTGNTRYWPWAVEITGPINLDGLQSARDQLFAEAVLLFRAGERWHPTREEQKALFEPEQDKREIQDLWEERIISWLRRHTSNTVTMTDIFIDCLGIKDMSRVDSARQMSTRIGNAMKRIGWKKTRSTTGDRGYFYRAPATWVFAETVTRRDEHVPY